MDKQWKLSEKGSDKFRMWITQSDHTQRKSIGIISKKWDKWKKNKQKNKDLSTSYQQIVDKCSDNFRWIPKVSIEYAHL